jgi:outer membrane protein assembly factor BamE
MTPHFSVRRCVAALGLLAAAMVLPACSSLDRVSRTVPEVVTPYRMDIVQGNVVTREQLAALQVGMPRQQVQSILGTPLLTSPFHAQRWDYTFTLKSQGVPAQDRHVTVFFKQDRLERIEADPLPSEADFVGSLRKRHELPPSKSLQASEAALAKYPPSSASNKAVAPALPLPGVSSYPPLEPAAVP